MAQRKKRILALGVNPSTRDYNETHPKVGSAFNTSSSPDPKVRETFDILCGKGNYYFMDAIAKRMSNDVVGKLSKERTLELCEKNKPKIVKKIKEFKPRKIVVFAKSKKFETIARFAVENYPNVVRVYQPRYAFGYGKLSTKKYVKHIEEEITKNDSRIVGGEK